MTNQPMTPEALDQWQPIETAPYGTAVRVKAGNMTFIARLMQGAAMSSLDETCDQWQAEYEGEHPPCWSGGACWETNEDEVLSLQPTAWSRLVREDVRPEVEDDPLVDAKYQHLFIGGYFTDRTRAELQGADVQQAPEPETVEPVALACYDAGLLNDWGGGNVEWWQDYIRAELARAHDFYADQFTTHPQQTEVVEALEEARDQFKCCGDLHTDKSDMEQALRNYGMADKMQNALNALKGSRP